MKKTILALLLCTSVLFAQETPQLTREGVTELIQPITGLSAGDLYSKTKEWVQTTYKNPSEVLKSDIENKTIRIVGYSEGFFFIPSMGKQYQDIEYGMTFLFKDGRCKINFELLNIYYNGGRSMHQMKWFFKKKDGSIKKVYKKSYNSFMESLTALYKGHYDYVTGATATANDDW